MAPESKGAEARPISCFDDAGFALLTRWWLQASWQRRYSYQFRWLGRPIIQLPGDILMMQDLIFRLRPTLIIETGIAHGGSLVLHASLLDVIYRHWPQQDAPGPQVVGIDLEIRPLNRAAIDEHPLRSMLTLIEGDSTDASTIEQAMEIARRHARVMVVLDSDHSFAHVSKELEAYVPLVSSGSAIVVMDGIMRELAALPDGCPTWEDDNPAAAVERFLKTQLGRQFHVDHTYDGWTPTHSPNGILLRDASGGE